MTPEQHQEQAEALLKRATISNFDEIQVHTLLSRATGTGTHYPAAQAALAESKRGDFPDVYQQLQIALAHARLADR